MFGIFFAHQYSKSNNSFTGTFNVVTNRQPDETYSFQLYVASGSGIKGGFSGNDRITITMPKNYTGFIEFSVSGTNSCGTRSSLIEDTINVCGTTSSARLASDQTAENTFTIYPNPTNNILNLEILDSENALNVKTSVSSEVYDSSTGLLKKQFDLQSYKKPLYVGDLEKGIYILKINIDGKIETHQFVIN